MSRDNKGLACLFPQVGDELEHVFAIARIEIAKEEMQQALSLDMFAEFTRIFKALGFCYVTLDTEGFRSGSMNALLGEQVLVKLRT